MASDGNKRARASSFHSDHSDHSSQHGDSGMAPVPRSRAGVKFRMTVSMPREQYVRMKAEAHAMSHPSPASSSSPDSLPEPRVRKRKEMSAPSPRSRARHDLSDGESDSEDPTVLYRSLRKEENPRVTGLLPPVGHDPSLSASQHITAGSRAKTKGPWISATRSKKVAAAWAAESDGQVVKFRKPAPSETPSFDMTNPDEARQVFPAMVGSSLNTAKASQEVVIKSRVPPENVIDVWKAKRVSVAAYHAATPQTEPDMVSKVRSRTKTTNRPTPVLLLRTPAPVAPATGASSSSNTVSTSSSGNTKI